MGNINPKARRVGIIIAVVLGIVAGLYAGGLVAQLISGYQIWLKEDGILGNAAMPAINFGFFYCIRLTFTPEGIKSAAFLGAGALAIYGIYLIHNRFERGTTDDRNFRRSERGTYGTAKWMDKKEFNQVLKLSKLSKTTDVILGEQNGSAVCLPNDTKLTRHIAVFGSTGTMKSRAFVRNYLFQALQRGESVVLTDPKSELYNDMAELFRQNEYCVRVYNLISPEHSDSWNCMADLSGDTLLAQILTDVIIENTADEDDRKDRFWDSGEGNFLKALILFVDQEASRGQEHKHLPAVYQMITQHSEKQLMAMFDKLPITHPAKAPFNLFKNASDNVRAGIISGIGTRLSVLQNAAVQNITRRSDIDLALPGKQKCIYFLILSDQDNSLSFLSSLFFSFLFLKLVRYADGRKSRHCKVPVNIMLEELNTCGTVHLLHKRMSSVRSRWIYVSIVAQNLAQLQNRYPKNRWAEILGNVDVTLMLGCSDEPTAEYFSNRTGDMTVEVQNNMTTRKTIAIAQVIPEYRLMEGQGRRKLMTVDEVLRMPNEELLIIIRGHNVLKARKLDYTYHPMAKKLITTDIHDYYNTGSEDMVFGEAYESIVNETTSSEEIAELVPTKKSKEPIKMPEAKSSSPAAPLYGSARPPDEF